MNNKKELTKASLPATEEFYHLLLDSTNQGFGLLEKLPNQQGQPNDYRYLSVNSAFERHSGLKNMIGKTIRELMPGVNPEIIKLYDGVADTGEKMQFEEYMPELDTWFTTEVFPTGISGTIAFLFNNISERKRIEARLQESEEKKAFLLKLSDALRHVADPVEIQAIASQLLGEHLDANQVHYGETSGDVVVIHQGWGNGLPPMVGSFRQLDFGKRLTEGYQSGRIQVSYDIHADPSITESERNVISGAGFNAYMAVPLIKNGQWVSTLAVHSIKPREWKQIEMDLVEETAERTWDAVARARAEAALRESESRYKNEAARLRAMLGSISDAVYIGDTSGISFANQTALNQLGYTSYEELNRNIGILAVEIQTRDADSHEVIAPENQVFAQALAGRHTVQNIQIRHRISGKEHIIRSAASPVIVDGKIVAAVAINTDITEQWLLAAALQESEERFRSFVMASSDLVYQMSSDWKKMYVLKSDMFLQNTLQTSSSWVAQYIPEEEHERVWAAINEAIVQKKMFDLEHQVIRADGQSAWVHSRALPVLNLQGEITEWRGAANNITLRKRAEQQLQDYNERLQQEVSERTAELQASKNQLQTVFDTTLTQMSILQAVRDESGQVRDFEIMLANKEHEREMGRTDLVGLHYVKEYPGMKQSVLFDLIVKTIETGEPQQTEYFYPYEDFNRWYSCMFVKFGDGVIATNMDISTRKRAEEERFKNYLLLQQSEDLALLGSWDYDVLSGTFSWSDGMYRLFNLEKETEIQPEIYLKYATEASRAAAERVVNYIRQGTSDFEETLDIDVSDQIKVLHLKATVVKNHQGNPVRVLGVDMDVTATRAAEQRIRKMEAEQQLEIFRVSLNIVEEERHRISESLHNGLGQLLYGIKINFSGIAQDMDREAFKESKGYINKLLSDAIKESRRISHELMPVMLEDFGLKVAIEDICNQLQDGVRFNCIVRGFASRLDKYLELAIYRTVQELMTNVVKHAQATQSTAEVTSTFSEIKIQVSDNGRGMEASKSGKPGIGLASIRSKIKLLNGTVSIESEAGNGTTVVVVIPKPQPQLLQ